VRHQLPILLPVMAWSYGAYSAVQLLSTGIAYFHTYKQTYRSVKAISPLIPVIPSGCPWLCCAQASLYRPSCCYRSYSCGWERSLARLRIPR
jgi:hypothetical protein